MDADKFESTIKEHGLSQDLQKFMQSHVDKQVERILAKKVEDLRVLGERETLVDKALADAGLSSNLRKYVQGNTAEEITTSTQRLRDDVLDAKQEKVNSELKDAGVPSQGISSSPSRGKVETETLEDYTKNRNKRDSESPSVTIGINKDATLST